jgi:mRNA interferase MazF
VSPLLSGEFVLADWKAAGLNVPSAVKRGLYTVHQSLAIKSVGKLSAADASKLEGSLRDWLDLR